MSTTAQVSVPTSIWKWVTTIGSARKLSPEDHRHIARWMSGNATPTVNQLIKLSNKLEMPFRYLFLAKPIDDTPEIFAHRTLRTPVHKHGMSQERMKRPRATPTRPVAVRLAVQ